MLRYWDILTAEAISRRFDAGYNGKGKQRCRVMTAHQQCCREEYDGKWTVFLHTVYSPAVSTKHQYWYVARSVPVWMIRERSIIIYNLPGLL